TCALPIFGLILGALSPSPRMIYNFIMYYVYCLKSKKDDSLYLGYTNDLKRRLVEHNSKKNKSTKHKTPFELVYYEAYKSKSDAKYREKQLKRFCHASGQVADRIRSLLADLPFW